MELSSHLGLVSTSLTTVVIELAPLVSSFVALDGRQLVPQPVSESALEHDSSPTASLLSTKSTHPFLLNETFLLKNPSKVPAF